MADDSLGFDVASSEIEGRCAPTLDAPHRRIVPTIQARIVPEAGPAQGGLELGLCSSETSFFRRYPQCTSS